MVAAAKISHRLGHLDEGNCMRIVNVIKQYGLPTHIPATPAFKGEKILAFVATDKKAVAGQPHFVLVKKIGDPFVTAEVPSAVVTDVIEELRR
jgi:3-dehydroquinate synthase